MDGKSCIGVTKGHMILVSLGVTGALTEESILLYSRRLPRWEAVAALLMLLLTINAVVVMIGYRFMGGNMFGQSS